MNKLYIIGNGFDLKHDLPSKYSDFASFCKTTNITLFEQINLLFPKISIDGLWSNFEEGLGEVKNDVLYKIFYEPYKENVRDDKFLYMVNSLQLAFRDWVKNLKVLSKDIQKHYIFNKDDCFISFNYTDLLESLYGINERQILHIHGYAKPDEEDNFVDYTFGHAQDEIKSIEPLDSFDNLSKDFKNSLKKNYKISEMEEKLKTWAKQGKSFNEIIVLGHSLNDVDDKYFVKLLQLIPNAKWYIEYFDYKDFLRKERNIVRIGLGRNIDAFVKS